HRRNFARGRRLVPVAAQLAAELLADAGEGGAYLVLVAEVLSRDAAQRRHPRVVVAVARVVEQDVAALAQQQIGVRGDTREGMLRLGLPQVGKNLSHATLL